MIYFFIVFFALFLPALANGAPLQLEVSSQTYLKKAHRVGVNLGQWSAAGPPALMRNVLMNPGLEGKIDRIIVIVSQADESSFSDEAGIVFPENTWLGAEFEIRTGPASRERGTIVKSMRSGSNGFPQYFTDKPLPHLDKGDIIVLTKTSPAEGVTLWRINDPSVVRPDSTLQRPGSYGQQSIVLNPTVNKNAEMVLYLDVISERAGITLPVNGPWHVSLWAKAKADKTPLKISFRRKNGRPPFFDKTLMLSTEWKEYAFDFIGKDQGPPGTLTFELLATTPEREIWVDDLYLGPKQEGSSSFRQEIIQALKQLNPSFLREFPNLGDTMENRLADPYQRKPWIYRSTGERQEAIFSYSWMEFFELCKEIGANPWLIIPPTFSDYELDQMGQFLAQEASRNQFSEVILEFGYETWNWKLRPLAIPNVKQNGEMAKRAFEKIGAHTKDQVNLIKLVNGEYGVPEVSLENLDSAVNADGVAVAPYFFYTLNNGVPDDEALTLMFQGGKSLNELANEVTKRRKRLAAYELNLSTTKGNAVSYERNRLVAGKASGSALAKRILTSLMAGADPVMVYNLGQYDTNSWDVVGFVKLWGIVRDFGPPLRFRPTGLAMIMLNQAIDGEMVQIQPKQIATQATDKLTMAAFKTSEKWSAALVSENEKDIEVEIQFPDDGIALPHSCLILEGSTPFATNETSEQVHIQQIKSPIEGRKTKFKIPSWGFVVLK